jgi:hypothetical protein
MSFANPTRLRLGLRGEFDGKDYQIIGRVVMSVDVDGEIYYWNEFNLQTDAGESATLVYEEGERGGEWRLFTMFEPEYPLTAADAATKRVGDALNLTGVDVRVTLRDISQVRRIEGQAPEGVEVGDSAQYFNAEAPGVMQVVSWSGEEIEFFSGVQLSPLVVESAFNLPRLTQPKLFSAFSGDGSSASADSIGSIKFILIAGVVLLIIFFNFGRNLSCSTTRQARPAKHIAAPKPPLMTGATGNWNGKQLTLTTHAVVEIAEAGVIYERHEYAVSDGSDAMLLLVCGLGPGAPDWILFSPLAPLEPPTPQQSAARKVGDVVNVDGVVTTVANLFQSTTHGVDSVIPTNWRMGDTSFGYFGRGEYFSLLVRWNQASLWSYRGKTVSAKEFSAAFSAK